MVEDVKRNLSIGHLLRMGLTVVVDHSKEFLPLEVCFWETHLIMRAANARRVRGPGILALALALLLAGCADEPTEETGTALSAPASATTTTFVPVLPDPGCGFAFAKDLEARAHDMDAATEERDRPVIEALIEADIGTQWDDAGVCVRGTGFGDGFFVTVLAGTLPDDLRAAALDAVPDGALVIEDLVWEGTPEPATWGLAPGEVVGPETTSFDVLIRENSCSSGRSAEGRIAPPMIDYGENTVDIAFIVYALPGGQTCPGPPPTTYSVTLHEQLGDRELMGSDGVYAQVIEIDPPGTTANDS